MSFTIDNSDRAEIDVKSEIYGDTLSVSPNWDLGHKGADESRLVFVRVNKNDRYGVRNFTISRDDAEALRDHLTLILDSHDKNNSDSDEPKGDTLDELIVAPAIDTRAVEAMEGLAHQLGLFFVDDLVDALNRHSDSMDAHANALNSFNK